MDSYHPASELVFGCPGVWFAWVIFGVGSTVFIYSMLKRHRLLRSGRRDPRLSNIGSRVTGLILHGFLQKRQPRYRFAGILHIIIFWGFLVLGIHSIDLIAAGLVPGSRLPFSGGAFGTVYGSLKDVFTIAVLAAVVAAGYRRIVLRPSRYQDSHQFEAYLVLFLIAFLMVSDMLFEGAKMGLEPGGHSIRPAAYLVYATLSGAETDTLKGICRWAYWLHLLCFFCFLNLLPLSKHFHIITALFNVFFRRLETGAVKPPRWEAMDIEQTESVGVRDFSDFTWKHILDFYSCTECGRCTDNCPANAVGKPLSPKQLTMDLRDFGYRNGLTRLRGRVQATDHAIGSVPDDVIWSCTTCGACERECPVFIEHIDKIIDLRRHRVSMESRFPHEIEQAYRNMEVFGDSFGMGAGLRDDWTRGERIDTVAVRSDIDVLFWVGCAGAFDSRLQQVSLAFSRILKHAEVNFAILGSEEGCCGDYARRTGNEYLFQLLAKRNIAVLEKYGIREIVTTCPHGYSALKNEYPQLGGNFSVCHSSEFIYRLIAEGRLTLSKPLEKSLAYHDPCYLGRHNGIYDVPRRVLESVPGVALAETDQQRDRSFCCGAGGGHYWMESIGQRMNDERADQLLSASPDMLVTGCPYCLIMLEDGIESKDLKGQVLVKDVAELVAESLG